MKVTLALFITVWISLTVQAQQQKLNDTNSKVSYAIGMDLGKNMLKADIDSIDVEIMLNGLRDVMLSRKTALNEEESQSVMMEFFQARTDAQLKAKQKEAVTFLQQNSKRDGVKVLPSGLQYEVIKMGTGKKPGAEDKVKVHYTGTLIDGKVFDSSIERGEPVVFPVNAVIQGWTEALQLMPVGSKWKLYIPAELAYGERGAGGIIGPEELLLFEVELLGIDKE